MDLVENIYYF